MKNQLRGSLSLLLATVIWGFAFTAQTVGMDRIGPMTFQTARCFLAVLFLVGVSLVLDLKNRTVQQGFQKWMDPKLWKAGLSCGLPLFIAASMQQVALQYTDAGKAGFLTAMYIVLVPVLGLFLGQKAPKTVVISVILAVAGLFLLSFVGVSAFNWGDLLLLGCALAFAVQITCVDRLSADLDSFRLNCVQAFIVSALSLPCAAVFEQIVAADILFSWKPLAFAGVLSMGVAYSLQIVGQKEIHPATASVIMSLESVFAALGGWWLMGQTMATHELLGCGLVFAAVLLSSVPGN